MWKANIMNLPFVREVIPFLAGALCLFGLAGLVFRMFGRRRTALFFYALAVVFSCYMLYFFRDPERISPDDPLVVLAGADGVIMGIKDVGKHEMLDADAVRISIFLSLFDVHVNRAPISGSITELGYYPGKRYFTFLEESSDHNQHSVILIKGDQTICLVKQITGPVARRVVYWLDLDQAVTAGQRIGMMKFGSRLDMYLPSADIEVLVKEGDRVTAGVTVVAKIAGLAIQDEIDITSDHPDIFTN